MIKGNSLCGGEAKGEALVFDVPFSFIGDVDSKNGEITMADHPLRGFNMTGKVLITTTGHGGTIAPFMAYEAHKNGCKPVAIVCNLADSITIECGIVMGIPVIDSFGEDVTKVFKTGDLLWVDGSVGTVAIGDN